MTSNQRVVVFARVEPEADARLNEAADVVGIAKSYAIDLILRNLTLAELVELLTRVNDLEHKRRRRPSSRAQ